MEALHDTKFCSPESIIVTLQLRRRRFPYPSGRAQPSADSENQFPRVLTLSFLLWLWQKRRVALCSGRRLSLNLVTVTQIGTRGLNSPCRVLDSTVVLCSVCLAQGGVRRAFRDSFFLWRKKVAMRLREVRVLIGRVTFSLQPKNG